MGLVFLPNVPGRANSWNVPDMTALRLAAMASRRADAFSSAVEGGFGLGVGFAMAFRRIPARARRTPPCFDREDRFFFVCEEASAATA